MLKLYLIIMFSRKVIKNSERVKLLKKLIAEKGFIKIVEVHNGLSGLIANNIIIEKNNKLLSFDGFWESSLTDSASKGLPDIELVSSDYRLETINQILEVTSKPMIVDGDTGGDSNQFAHLVRRLERAGVSMIIIEDKIFPKRNSFADSYQDLEDITIFSEKISKGVSVKQDKDFLIVARLESLISGGTVGEAIIRAKAFLKAGADGIMIHSKSSEPSEILEFAKQYSMLPKKITRNKVLVCVPTTYNTITTKELAQAGFNIIIYANHQLRAAYKAMEEVCKNILLYDRAFEVDPACMPVKKVFETVGMLEIIQADKERGNKR